MNNWFRLILWGIVGIVLCVAISYATRNMGERSTLIVAIPVAAVLVISFVMGIAGRHSDCLFLVSLTVFVAVISGRLFSGYSSDAFVHSLVAAVMFAEWTMVPKRIKLKRRWVVSALATVLLTISLAIFFGGIQGFLVVLVGVVALLILALFGRKRSFRQDAPTESVCA